MFNAIFFEKEEKKWIVSVFNSTMFTLMIEPEFGSKNKLIEWSYIFVFILNIDPQNNLNTSEIF